MRQVRELQLRRARRRGEDPPRQGPGPCADGSPPENRLPGLLSKGQGAAGLHQVPCRLQAAPSRIGRRRERHFVGKPSFWLCGEQALWAAPDQGWLHLRHPPLCTGQGTCPRKVPVDGVGFSGDCEQVEAGCLQEPATATNKATFYTVFVVVVYTGRRVKVAGIP